MHRIFTVYICIYTHTTSILADRDSVMSECEPRNLSQLFGSWVGLSVRSMKRSLFPPRQCETLGHEDKRPQNRPHLNLSKAKSI